MINFKIHVLMAQKRLSQKELCELTGISPSVMNKYYHGTIARISPEHLNMFCKIFNCNVQDIIEYSSDKED